MRYQNLSLIKIRNKTHLVSHLFSLVHLYHHQPEECHVGDHHSPSCWRHTFWGTNPVLVLLYALLQCTVLQMLAIFINKNYYFYVYIQYKIRSKIFGFSYIILKELETIPHLEVQQLINKRRQIQNPFIWKLAWQKLATSSSINNT